MPPAFDLWTVLYLLRRHWAIALQVFWLIVLVILYVDFAFAEDRCLDECLGPASHLAEWLAVEVVVLPLFLMGLPRLWSDIRERRSD